MADYHTASTLALLQKVWALFLIAVYFAGFMNAYHFPGNREKPLEGEALLWDVQKVLFFAMMFVAFLIDIVRSREDRNRAFIFLFLSLILGGFSVSISALQFQGVAFLFGR
ncbi:MAG: hypothetical protein ACE5E9_04180 [Nitrospinaceae bacterium]